jgi:3-phenylpropionate/trans-cinnamate dioxygenase ferredoxin subunit
VDESFVRVCAVADVRQGSVIAREVNGTPLALVHCDDGSIRAVYDECSHAQIPLSEGDVDGCTLECWLHGSRFDLASGKPSGPPASEPIPIYPVEIHDGDIYVGLVSSNGVQP